MAKRVKRDGWVGWAGLALGLASALGAGTARAQMGPPPPIHGIGLVQYGVRDVGKTAAFFRKLGIEEAFRAGQGAAAEVFLKVNDRQFVVLEQVHGGEPAGFREVSFDVDAAEVLRQVYAGRGVTVSGMGRSAAGMTGFRVTGPEGQPIGYLQEAPGSLPARAAGQPVAQGRIGDEVMAVGVPFADRDKARTFFLERLSFGPTAGRPWLLDVPGPSTEELLLEQKPERARLYLRVKNEAGAMAALKARGVPAKAVPGAIEVADPDGNPLEFESGQLAVAVGTAR